MATWTGNGPNSRTFVSNIKTGERSWQVDLNTQNHSEIKEMQQKMTNLGYSTQGADGTYGNNTKAAVTNFQRAYPACGTPDGYFGKSTLNTFVSKVGSLAGYTGTGGGGTTPSTGTFYKATVSKSGVNIRKTTSTEAATWGRIDQNRRIIVQDIDNSNWYRTFWGNNPGANAYIKADCVTLGAACSTKKERVLYLVENNALFQKYTWYFGGNLTTKTGGLSGQWCQSFCNWVMTAAGLTTNDAPLSESNAKNAKDEFAKSSTSFTFITSNPQPGDVIYYKWAGSSNTVDHAGLIYHVSGNTIYSYEGNRGQSVDAKSKVSMWTISIGDPQIVGYGRPAY